MKKVLLQALTVIALFFSTWFGLTQIDWVSIFQVKMATAKTEEKLGELFWEMFKKTEKEDKRKLVVSSVDTLVTKICNENKIDKDQIKLHVLDKDEVNAFALPDGHLIVYSGLISETESPEELAGVLGHEIAHIQLQHIMKKLVSEVGLSVLVSMASGNSSAGKIQETVKVLSSSSFNRSLEKDADLKAVEYLTNANINPEPFANFLYKLAAAEPESMKYLSLLSTHPASKERAEYIIEAAKGKEVKSEPVLNKETWQSLKEKLKEE